MRTFRLLRPDEIECRISEVAKDGSYLSLLLYKTARTDAALLDEKFGPFRWSNDYKVIGGKMYCGIGIRDADKGDWVWKWNVGTESNTEAEKGEASDAMKRAGFVWGIGTELYSSPRIYVKKGDCNIKEKKGGNGYVCYDRFDVSKIGYDESERISMLEIVNTKTGRVCFRLGSEQPGSSPAPRKEQKTAAPPSSDGGPAPGQQTMLDAGFKCRRCKKPIDERTAAYTMERFKMRLCTDCQVAAAAYEQQIQTKGENNT